MHADVIVIGLGAMGGAAAYDLASRGARVVGIDRYSPPHVRGSSHGRTRIIREAYFEDPAYVPLVQRAYARWADIEQESGSTLLKSTGGLMIGPANGTVAGGAELSATTHGLAHERLSAKEVNRRFPAFRIPDDMIAILEPRAGVLFVEESIKTLLSLARRHGAQLMMNEPVVSWSAWKGQVDVTTTRDRYSAERLVVAAGPWIGSLLPGVNVPLQIERARMYWFREIADKEIFTPDRFPIFAIEHSPATMLYGFPDLGDGVKVAIYHGGETVDPDDSAERAVAPEPLRQIRDLVATYLPLANGDLLAYEPCLYTNTPDFNFILDVHPEHENVVVVSPCSGHGFKFASVVGEIVGDLIVTGRSRLDIGLFSLKRFVRHST